MSEPNDLDQLLRDWPFDPATLNVRLAQGVDGRDVLQMRVDMGILQLEVEGRPDGHRPQGFETYYDYLLSEAVRVGDDFELSAEQCQEVDREFVQFYHRRICWLRLKMYEQAADDAEHTLSLMDFCRISSPDDQWTMSHEQYRPFVMFHRIQATALAALERENPETAIIEINQGLEALKKVFEEFEAEDQFEEDELVLRLQEMREALRHEYALGKTLDEQLAEAVAKEQYELAARLRDELARRK
jgi:hypothetical protein